MRKRVFFALVFLMILQPAAWPQQTGETGFEDNPAMPGGVKGERIRSLIDTVNSGDAGRIRRFLSEECTEEFRTMAPMETHINVFLGLLRETGGIEFHGIRTYIPGRKGETVVIVKDKNLGNWLGLTLRFAGGAGFLVSGAAFGDARTPTDVVEPSLSADEIVGQTKAVVRRLIEKDSFSGALLIARGDDILLTMAGGKASRAFHVLNNVDTKFNLGSMNKMFTSTAVMRLVEKGKLSLDDPIGKYIDESWLPGSVTEKIIIRHLLTHTSGLGSYFNETFVKSSRDLFRKLDDYKPLIKDDKPAFEPGSRYRYSNTGMFLLGVIIEKATGEDYFEHIRKAIYAPAGMTDTDCYEMDHPVENLAIGYSPDPQSPSGWRNNLYTHVIKGGPAGGGFSTVRDLHKFALALLGRKYVAPGTLKIMWTDYMGAGYGYGFYVDRGSAGTAVGHSGGFDGINSTLNIYVDSGYIIAVMSNVDRGAVPLARKIGSLLGRLKK